MCVCVCVCGGGGGGNFSHEILPPCKQVFSFGQKLSHFVKGWVDCGDLFIFAV